MFMLYIPETDTLEIVYREELGPVADTLDGPREWITLDVDGDERLVSMTIEHATTHAPPHVQIADARRLLDETDASFDVVYLDAEGHLDLTATYDAASPPAQPKSGRPSGP
jgi:uncharacterized protein YuzE